RMAIDFLPKNLGAFGRTNVGSAENFESVDRPMPLVIQHFAEFRGPNLADELSDTIWRPRETITPRCEIHGRCRPSDRRSWRGPRFGSTGPALFGDHDRPDEHDASERLRVEP